MNYTAVEFVSLGSFAKQIALDLPVARRLFAKILRRAARTQG